MSTIKSSDEHLTLNADGANNDIKFQSNGSEVASIDQAGLVTGSKLNLTQSAGTAGTVTIGGTTNAYSAPVLLTVSDLGLDITDGTKHLASWASHGGSSHAGSAIGTRSNHDLALITNDTKAVFIDTTGAVTMPSQPAFLLQQTSNVSNVTGNGTNHTMVYGTETFDQNADCSTSTFTAPVTGKYHFDVSIAFVSLSSATDVFIDLMTSNRNYRWNPTGNNPTVTGNTSYPVISGSVLADMDASDTAYVKVHVNGVGADSVDIYGDAMSTTNFAGYLVC